MTESTLSKKVRSYLLSMAPHVKAIRKDQSEYSGNTGISDWLICVGGIFVAMELKVGNNELTMKQEIFLRDIKEAGGVAITCRSLEEVKKVVKAILPHSVTKKMEGIQKT